MGLFTSETFNNLEDLYIDQLQDLYDAEMRLTKALPKLAEAASSPQLRSAFEHHLRETEGHVARLKQAFRLVGKDAQSKTCNAMKGLISEADEMISAHGDADVKDAALIAAAQRVEHYEIAAYGTARQFAQRIGQSEAANLLQATLDEEKSADGKLTELAESAINIRAQHA